MRNDDMRRKSVLARLSPRAGAVGLVLLLARAASAEPAMREWRFDVLLDDAPIGRQTFDVTTEGDTERVVIKAEMDVKFLFFTAYSYRHENEEVWKGGCLQRIASKTNDNGDAARVVGSEGPQGFAVETAKGSETLDDCVWSYAYWDERVVTRTRLLNSQTGTYDVVQFALVGSETLVVLGLPVEARRYELRGPTFTIDLWYSSSGEWLALESHVRGGRRLRYVRQPA